LLTREILSLAYRKRRLEKEDVEAIMRLYREEKLFEKDLEVFWNLKLKRRLTRKDFVQLYDLIWQNSAPVKYQNPENWRAHGGDEK
jgi:hypothetical protein